MHFSMYISDKAYAYCDFLKAGMEVQCWTTDPFLWISCRNTLRCFLQVPTGPTFMGQFIPRRSVFRIGGIHGSQEVSQKGRHQ